MAGEIDLSGHRRPLRLNDTFPGLSSAELAGFVRRRGTVGENALEEEFRQWIRTSLKLAGR